MDSVRQALIRHHSLVLMFSAMLFGLAYGLGHERDIVPIPGWFSANLSRFCFALMAWTALMQRSPLQLLAWSVTDFVMLSLPFFAGVMFTPDLQIRELFAYEIVVGKVAAGGVLGVSVCQAVISLFPSAGKPSLVTSPT